MLLADASSDIVFTSMVGLVLIVAIVCATMLIITGHIPPPRMPKWWSGEEKDASKPQ